MKQRVITVPKNKKAAYDLDYDKAMPNQLIELYLSESDFYVLQESDAINKINMTTGSLIDDYESDSICDPDDIANVIYILEEIVKGSNSEQKKLLLELLSLFKEAFQRKTGVFFFF